MIDNFILAWSSLILWSWELKDRDAIGPEIGVCFHRPQSEMDIEKNKPMRGQSSGRG